MVELTAGYEEFIKNRKINKKGLKQFNAAIKKAATPKQRGSK